MSMSNSPRSSAILNTIFKTPVWVFHRVVLVHLQVALAGEREAYAAVVRNLLQHMVEKVQASADAGRAFPVQVQRQGDVRFAGFPGDGHLAGRAPDGLGDFRPGHRPHLQRLGSQVLGQFHVRLPVADDKTPGEVVRAVQIGSEHPRPGLPGRGVVLREGLVDQDVVKDDPFAFQGVQHQVLARPEGIFREGRRAQPVLVGDEDEFVAQPGQGLQAGDGAGDEGELLQGVDLLVGRLHEDGAVPVDEKGFLEVAHAV